MQGLRQRDRRRRAILQILRFGAKTQAQASDMGRAQAQERGGDKGVHRQGVPASRRGQRGGRRIVGVRSRGIRRKCRKVLSQVGRVDCVVRVVDGRGVCGACADTLRRDERHIDGRDRVRAAHRRGILRGELCRKAVCCALAVRDAQERQRDQKAEICSSARHALRWQDLSSRTDREVPRLRSGTPSRRV